jgi:alanyl-tRNA synthetase
MPDRKRFYDDPALVRLETRVIEAGERAGRPWVRLEETLFYPEGGGQPSDRGTIGGALVIDVVADGDTVVHVLDRVIPPGPVSLVLDAARRFDHCQQHTAQHLLTAVLLDRHGMPTTSFHLGADYTAIEVKGPTPDRARLREYEREVNAVLREDRLVATRWVDPEDLARLPVRSRGLPDGHRGPVRLVEIEGLDLNTCGGTHVGRLGEIQVLEIVDAEPARGGTRIRFLAGGRALAAGERRRDVEEALKARIGTAPGEFATVVDGWNAERKRLSRRARELESELALHAAADLAARKGPTLAAVREGADAEALRALARAVLDRRPDAVVALVGDGCFLVEAGPKGPADVASVGARVRDLLGAKGGGKGRTFQGKGGRRCEPAALSEAVGAVP